VNLTRIILLVCCCSLLAGCAALFGRSTDDPALKLKWASEHYASRDEPVQAEKLIRDALALSQKTNNRPGMAAAYREYGLFFRSNAVTKFETYYTKEGFLDRTASFAGRYAKAAEYFNKAKDIFTENNQHEALSNVYLSLAKTYVMLNRQQAACDAFDEGMKSYNAFKKGNPEAREFRAEELSNYEEYVAEMKKQGGCP